MLYNSAFALTCAVSVHGGYFFSIWGGAGGRERGRAAAAAEGASAAASPSALRARALASASDAAVVTARAASLPEASAAAATATSSSVTVASGKAGCHCPAWSKAERSAGCGGGGGAGSAPLSPRTRSMVASAEAAAACRAASAALPARLRLTGGLGAFFLSGALGASGGTASPKRSCCTTATTCRAARLNAQACRRRLLVRGGRFAPAALPALAGASLPAPAPSTASGSSSAAPAGCVSQRRAASRANAGGTGARVCQGSSIATTACAPSSPAPSSSTIVPAPSVRMWPGCGMAPPNPEAAASSPCATCSAVRWPSTGLRAPRGRQSSVYLSPALRGCTRHTTSGQMAPRRRTDSNEMAAAGPRLRSALATLGQLAWMWLRCRKASTAASRSRASSSSSRQRGRGSAAARAGSSGREGTTIGATGGLCSGRAGACAGASPAARSAACSSENSSGWAAAGATAAAPPPASPRSAASCRRVGAAPFCGRAVLCSGTGSTLICGRRSSTWERRRFCGETCGLLRYPGSRVSSCPGDPGVGETRGVGRGGLRGAAACWRGLAAAAGRRARRKAVCKEKIKELVLAGGH